MLARANMFFWNFVLLVATERVKMEIITGFHFNKNREQLWTLPSDELKENSSWLFNFAKYGNCLRLDLLDFKMPHRFTLCFSINHDITDTFAIMNLVSTNSGLSALKILQETP